MKLKATFAGLATVLAIASSPASAASRDYISIVGSSTVYPFSTVVAERFGKTSGKATPKVESTGTGGGMKLFCAGVGTDHPDITNASRRMKKSEFDDCQKNGVKDVVEVMVGYDGIVLANSVKAERMTLSVKDIFLALAKNVPNPDGSETLVANPYKTWKDVNPALPNKKIEVLGPPPTSGTRDAFAELALEGGCAKFGFIKAMKKADKKKYKAVCHGVREDGAYVEAGENDNLIIHDRFKGRQVTVNLGTLNLVAVLIKEAETEHAKRVLVLLELLDDQVVVLTGLNIGAVFTNTVTDRLVLLLVGLLHVLD